MITLITVYGSPEPQEIENLYVIFYDDNTNQLKEIYIKYSRKNINFSYVSNFIGIDWEYVANNKHPILTQMSNEFKDKMIDFIENLIKEGNL